MNLAENQSPAFEVVDRLLVHQRYLMTAQVFLIQAAADPKVNRFLEPL